MDNGRPSAAAGAFSGRTAWARNLQTPLREFLRTETGERGRSCSPPRSPRSSGRTSTPSYERVWQTTLSIQLGDWGVALDLRELGQQRA